jgi:general secretion pathway protein A
MYLDYWQLEAKPFEPICKPPFVVAWPGRQAAQHKLRYALENRRAAVVLAGPPGVGKTELACELMEASGPSLGPWVNLVFPHMSPSDLLVYLAEQLGAPAADPPRYTTEESLRRLEFVLQENCRRGRHAAFLIDEAHLLEDAGLIEPLRLLLNLAGPGRQPLLTLMLVGQPTLLPMLQRYPAFEQRIDVKAVLHPLDAAETARYVTARLQAAGATRELFTPEALAAVRSLTGGVPRRINRLCDLALLVGYADQSDAIDADCLQAVSDELVTVAA